MNRLSISERDCKGFWGLNWALGYEVVLETADMKEVEITVAPDGKVLEDSGEEKKEPEK